MIAAPVARRLLGRLLDTVAALLLLGALAVTVAQVTARSLLGVPMPWGADALG